MPTVVPADRILLTGGSGRLGTELRALLPGIIAPSHAEMDVTDPASVASCVAQHHPLLLIHAAAYTNVARAELERAACWQVNVGGTRHVVAAAIASGTPLVHISTDYVFDGQRGGYKEDDTLGPALNHYALSKIVAEEVARTAPHCLVIRTSFRPREWPYPVAFTDVYTSQDYVDVIAPEIALATQHAPAIPWDTLHIATERKSVFDLARRRRADVRPGEKAGARVALPDDISLDTTRWSTLRIGLASEGV